MRLLVLTIVFFGGSFIFAQSDVFETDGKGNRDIERSSRIPSAPKIVDNILVNKVTSRPLLELNQRIVVRTDTIEAATVETEQMLNKFYPFYLKAGMGSALMPFAELYVNSTRSRNNYYGFHAKHLSFFGTIKDREHQRYAPAGFDRTSLLGTFETFQSSYTLLGQLHYLNHGFHYYGLTQPNANADSIAQRYQTVDAKLTLDTHPRDTARFNVRATANFRFTSTAAPYSDSLKEWKAKEQAFNLNMLGYYKTEKNTFHGLLGLRYNGYAYGILDSVLMLLDSGLLRKNPVFDLQPGVKSYLLNQRLLVDAGFTVSIDGGPSTKAYFFPNVYAQYAFAENSFVPFLHLGGQVKQNSLHSLYSLNPFINPNVLIQNEINPYDIQLGIKAKISKNFHGGLSANFTKVNNRAFFVTDTLMSSGNRFMLVYDSLNITTLEGKLTYQSGSKININLIGRYNSYEMLHEVRAWNLPNVEIILGGTYNLYDKLLMKADVSLAMNRFAKVSASAPNTAFENNQYFVSLGSIIDANLGLEYRYNKRLSGFLQINNLAAQRYLQFYNYPVMPIQVLAGITCKF
jgi:hypothetical protein